MNKLLLLILLGLGFAVAPLASAQRVSRHPESPRFSNPRFNPGVSRGRAFQGNAPRMSAPRFSNRNSGRNWNRGDFRGRRFDGNRRGFHRGRWGHRHHRRHHRHRRFYPFYYSSWPFGFGYPYWGTSVAYYYDGTPGYADYGSAESLAVAVQQELARAGYYHGAIDGIIGSGTRRALRAYESAHGLPMDGRIDSDLLATMGLG